jgi:group I intron endonuclease
MKNCYLYKIVNQINGKTYIGITSEPTKRKQRHFSKTGHSAFSIIRVAMDKYGRENFSFEILCVGSKEYILDLEIKAIALYRTCEKRFGYNIKPGGQSGRGYSVNGTKRDVPTFVSGFWFPNRRTTVAKLNITVDVYKNRKKRGTLESITQTYQVKSNKGVIRLIQVPRYVGGFWFPSFNVASVALDKVYSVLVSRYARGDVEEFIPQRRGGNQRSDQNHMYGIDPKDHPSSIAVIINNIKYDSIKQATADTGFSKYIINSRIKENHPDFQYA